MMTRINSREFNQALAQAKRATRSGPVIITDRGKPAHVLLRYEDYQRLIGSESLADALDDPAGATTELPLPLRSTRSARIPDLLKD